MFIEQKRATNHRRKGKNGNTPTTSSFEKRAIAGT